MIKILFEGGADVNARGAGGRTALMAAAVNEYDLNVKTLLALGADVNLRDIQGRTALTRASLHGPSSKNVQDLLTAGAQGSPTEALELEDFPMFAVQGQPTSMAPGRTLWSGTRDREIRTKIVAMLLDHPADPNLNPYFYHGRYFRNPATDLILCNRVFVGYDSPMGDETRWRDDDNSNFR